MKLLSIVASFTLLTVPAVSAAETLGDALRESGWIRILGTWVDQETKGEKLTTTYAWRYKETLIEETTQVGQKEIVSLIGLNPKTQEIFLMSADNQGGSSIGTFEKKEKNSSTLGVLFVTPQGEEGAVKIRYEFENDDTLIVTLELPEPIVFRLVRSQRKRSDRTKGSTLAHA